MRIYNALTSLLRAALWGSDPERSLFDTLSDDEWDALFTMALDQAVAGVTYSAIATLPVPDITAMIWKQAADAIVERNAQVAAVQNKQMQVWQKAGLKPYVLKGSVCASLYPVPELRQSGDIDWCFAPDEWDRAVAIVRRNGLECKLDSDGDFSYTVAGVVVEHHHKGMPSQSGAGQIFFLADHVFHHFSTSGVGLRQLCDLALAIRKVPFDSHELEIYLKRAGLRRFYKLACAFIANDLCRDCGTGCGTAVPERDLKRFRALVMKDANFGLVKERRFSGLSARTYLCMKYAPIPFIKRWTGLFRGRFRRLWIGKIQRND